MFTDCREVLSGIWSLCWGFNMVFRKKIVLLGFMVFMLLFILLLLFFIFRFNGLCEYRFMKISGLKFYGVVKGKIIWYLLGCF